MRYQNRQPAEGINTSSENPLKEFAQLLIGITVLLLAVIFLLNAFIGTVAKFIPFEYERSMVSGLDILQLEESKQQAYLQNLADKLADNMDLDEDIVITVHYSDSKTVNALATIGGHVFFFEGLVNELQSEQALAAVMAHEIAHIKHRHPISALGKGITLGALAAFISGSSGSSAGDWLIGSSLNLSMLKFSRSQETEADATAAQALFNTYGDIGGADKLFQRFSELESGDATSLTSLNNTGTSDIFRSHPFSTERWETLKALAQKNGWPLRGELSPLNFPETTD